MRKCCFCKGCPFAKPQNAKPQDVCCFADRSLRSLYFALRLLGSAVPAWQERISPLLKVTGLARDLTELSACVEDYIKITSVLNSKRENASGRLLKILAKVTGLGASFITPLPVFEEWGWIDLKRHSTRVAHWARGLSAAGYFLDLSSRLVDPNKWAVCPKTGLKTTDSFADCLYMVGVELDWAPRCLQAPIGVVTGLWGAGRSW